MPILHCPGVITPGQFGPTKRTPGFCRNCSTTRTMSKTGMPSVIATITRMPASAASRMASAAAAGGTKTILASAPVFRTASCTVLKRGNPSLTVPPLPGVTPPTTCVPYSRHCCAWNNPALPMPWVRTRVCLSTRMLMVSPARFCQGFRLFRRFVAGRSASETLGCRHRLARRIR
ncbi:hypothetical protein HRbin36_02260 [bacterium HR36]|nr:hypothetical protein HRbin36_02260 [bacterium HR36]